MQHFVEQRLAADWPPATWQDVTVVVAVSGGADSVALLRALAALQAPGAGRLLVAHFDHALRGVESARDARFVAELAASLGLACVTEQWERPIGRAAPTPENASRQARYAFLRRIADSAGARFVATAHTLDDQAETVLHHILRGTGLRGLRGVPRLRRLSPLTVVVRPLLAVRRKQLRKYLRDIGQEHREDATNAEAHALRNRLRHRALPYLTRLFGRDVAPALARLAGQAQAAQEVLDHATGDLCAQATGDLTAGFTHVDCRLLVGLPRAVVRETLVAVWMARNWPRGAMTQSEWERLTDLVTAPLPGAAANFPGAVHAVRRGHRLELSGPGQPATESPPSPTPPAP